jgi:UDPglucose 6-dehydrogenase
MRVMFVGLGKLGLPVALALRAAGHDVVGVDSNPLRASQIAFGQVSDEEPLVREYLERYPLSPVYAAAGQVNLGSWRPEVVLVAVQTPHEPQFEGVTPLEEPPRDFDYSYLQAALAEVVAATAYVDPLIVTISTCLPGTYEHGLRQIVGSCRYAYNPFFIAVGSVIEDFRHPEFLLVGREDHSPGYLGRELAELYGPVTGVGDVGAPPVHCMSIVSAELTKVAYNAWLGFKLMLTNGIGMTAEATGADADDVMGALGASDRRILSPAYMRVGMGDGGSCHPRDMIAMSWLARRLGLPHDPYSLVVAQREAHAQWLAEIWHEEARKSGLPMVMLGMAYKPETTITTGSHALLVAYYARELAGEVRMEDRPFRMERSCFFLATPHEHFLTWVPKGSVMVDPWGVYPVIQDVRLVRPGRGGSETQWKSRVLREVG